MNGLTLLDTDYSDFVEVDPTGRYGRYNEILGKGAVKTVYRAFDEYQGIEVAWNQVKLYDFLQSPEDLERLYCEIHLLKTLKHKNIMKFYTSWVDTANRNINFVTEMFTSGTLRQYRLKHRKVNIRAIKHWCRQILKGLLYLHSHDPPIIHRDLKCDNIFVNGNQGELKIGDLGLAAILRKSHAVHCVGTPEFMAPEVYEEAYNELVDIYSFGMCILEMVTFEYPYSECTHPAQIYKKVISGKKPDALYTVKDPEVRQFIEKCLATVSLRLSARELLEDPFLQIDDSESDLRSVDYGEVDGLGPILREPYRHPSIDSYATGYCNGFGYVDQNDWSYHSTDVELNGIDLFEYHEDEHPIDVDISIKGKKRDDGSIYMRLRIMDKDGHIRNIHFPFDIENDRAFSVATEMVEELDLNDQDVTRIADMIDGEIASLVPEWRPGLELVDSPRVASQNFIGNCVSNHTSNGSLMEFLKTNLRSKGFQLQIRHNRSASHGRFEQVTYEVDETENQVGEGTTVGSDQSEGLPYQERWDHHESRELSTVDSDHFHTDEEYESLDHPACGKSDSDAKFENKAAFQGQDSAEPVSSPCSCSTNRSCDHDIYESEIQQMRWLKAKHQLELRELKDHQFELTSKSLVRDDGETSCGIPSSFSARPPIRKGKDFRSDGSFCLSEGSPGSGTQRVAGSRAAIRDSPRTEAVTNAKKMQSGSLLPNLHRTTSLPVDAVHM